MKNYYKIVSKGDYESVEKAATGFEKQYALVQQLEDEL